FSCFLAPAPPSFASLSLHDALPISGSVLSFPVILSFICILISHFRHFDILMRDDFRDVPGFRPPVFPDDDFLSDDPFLDDLEPRSEEHTSELQSRFDLVCRLLLEKK